MALNVGFIGLKGHWYPVAEEIAGLPDVNVAAIAGREPDAQKALAGFPGATADTRAYDDYREMLERHKLDVVVEADNDRDRADTVAACAERGIHVIAEKPLAKDLAGLERVQRAVEQSGIQLSMLVTMRCSPGYLAMKEAVVSGAVGEVTQVGAQKSYKMGERPAWQKSRDTFSGIIPFVGIHVMDLMRWVTGREFVEIMAYAGNTAHPEVGDLDDNACLAARLDNGASAAVRLDYCRPAAAPTHGDDRLRVAGDKGVIESIAGKVTLITAEEGPRELPQPDPVAFFADYVAALREGRDPFIPYKDCVRITEVVLRARESAETGRPVSI